MEEKQLAAIPSGGLSLDLKMVDDRSLRLYNELAFKMQKLTMLRDYAKFRAKGRSIPDGYYVMDGSKVDWEGTYDRVSYALMKGMAMGIQEEKCLEWLWVNPKNNQIQVYGEGVPYICQNDPRYESVVIESKGTKEDGDLVVTARVKTSKLTEEVTVSFSWADCVTAGLDTRSTFKQYPRDMCTHKVWARVQRLYFPGATAGLPIKEDMIGVDDTPQEETVFDASAIITDADPTKSTSIIKKVNAILKYDLTNEEKVEGIRKIYQENMGALGGNDSQSILSIIQDLEAEREETLEPEPAPREAGAPDPVSTSSVEAEVAEPIEEPAAEPKTDEAPEEPEEETPAAEEVVDSPTPPQKKTLGEIKEWIQEDPQGMFKETYAEKRDSLPKVAVNYFDTIDTPKEDTAWMLFHAIMISKKKTDGERTMYLYKEGERFKNVSFLRKMLKVDGED